MSGMPISVVGVTQRSATGVKQLVRGMCQVEEGHGKGWSAGIQSLLRMHIDVQTQIMHHQDHLDEQPGDMWLDVS